MKINAGDVRSRVTISRLLTKLEQSPEYGRKYGVEDTSHFQNIDRSEAAQAQKEVK